MPGRGPVSVSGRGDSGRFPAVRDRKGRRLEAKLASLGSSRRPLRLDRNARHGVCQRRLELDFGCGGRSGRLRALDPSLQYSVRDQRGRRPERDPKRDLDRSDAAAEGGFDSRKPSFRGIRNGSGASARAAGRLPAPAPDGVARQRLIFVPEREASPPPGTRSPAPQRSRRSSGRANPGGGAHGAAARGAPQVQPRAQEGRHSARRSSECGRTSRGSAAPPCASQARAQHRRADIRRDLEQPRAARQGLDAAVEAAPGVQIRCLQRVFSLFRRVEPAQAIPVDAARVVVSRGARRALPEHPRAPLRGAKAHPRSLV